LRERRGLRRERLLRVRRCAVGSSLRSVGGRRGRALLRGVRGRRRGDDLTLRRRRGGDHLALCRRRCGDDLSLRRRLLSRGDATGRSCTVVLRSAQAHPAAAAWAAELGVHPAPPAAGRRVAVVADLRDLDLLTGEVGARDVDDLFRRTRARREQRHD
jgi:hypothetical protein